MGAIAMQYNASAHGTNNHRSTTRLPPRAPMKLSWALLFTSILPACLFTFMGDAQSECQKCDDVSFHFDTELVLD